MHALFGQAHESMVNMFGADGLHDNGHDEYFYYGIEYPNSAAGYEEFVVYDGCGRSIPVDIDSIDSMIEALEYIRNYSEAIRNDANTVVSFGE